MNNIVRWSTALVAVMSMATASACSAAEKEPAPPQMVPAGSEVDSNQGGAYGWHKAMAVGERFTDGMNHLELSGEASAPMKIVSVRPLMDGGPALRVLGVRVRLIPDMLPKDAKYGWFELSAGFPPEDAWAAGGVDPEGFEIKADGDGSKSVEIQIGYEVVAEGTSNRSGVEVVYEYGGVEKRAVVPSHLTICAPVKAPCEAQKE